MNLGDSLRATETGRTPAPADFFLEAKRQVMSLARQGRLMSPQEAWILAGSSKGRETLWSVAYGIGTANDVSPEDIYAYLEVQFPRYSKGLGLPAPSWDEVRY